jgi:ABC-type glycerol-3-phosphate transport system substrate-binding protein
MVEDFLDSAKSGDGPDVQWIPQEDLSKAVASGELAPLRRLTSRRWWWEHNADFLLPSSREDVAVPIDAVCYGLLYRVDLFAAEGIAVPFGAWSEMADAAEKLTGYDDYIYTDRYGIGMGFASEDADIPPVLPAALAAGGAPDTMGEAEVEGEKLAFGFELLAELTEAGVLHPNAREHTAEEVYRAFNAGTYGMIMGSTGRFARVRREVVVSDPGDVGFLALPSVSGGPSTPVVEAWHVGVRRRSPLQSEAAKFVRFLLSPASDRIWVEEAEHLPLRRSTLEELEAGGVRLERAHLVAAGRLISGGSWREPPALPSAEWRRIVAAATVKALRGDGEPGPVFEGAVRQLSELIESPGRLRR